MDTYQGTLASISIDGDLLTLTKSKAVGADSVRRIPLQAVTDVRFKPAGKLTGGWIQLVLANEPPSKAYHDNPNTVVFTSQAKETFNALHERLTAAIAENQVRGVDPTAFPYDLPEENNGIDDRVKGLTEKIEARENVRVQQLTKQYASYDNYYYGL